MSKLTIYNRNHILTSTKTDIIINHNAFVLPDGEFILADGFDSRNATHVVERSANEISKFLVPNKNILDEYRKCIHDDASAMRFYYLREILIHYYGLALYADTSSLNSTFGIEYFNNMFSYFTIPASNYFGKQFTAEQFNTIKLLMRTNGDSISEYQEQIAAMKVK